MVNNCTVLPFTELISYSPGAGGAFWLEKAIYSLHDVDTVESA